MDGCVKVVGISIAVIFWGGLLFGILAIFGVPIGIVYETPGVGEVATGVTWVFGGIIGIMVIGGFVTIIGWMLGR